jgi:hypothetical protein
MRRRTAKANLKTLEEAEDIGRKLGPAVPASTPVSRRSRRTACSTGAQKTLGDAFIESKGYKDAINEYRENGGRFREGFAIPSVALEIEGHAPRGRRRRRWRYRRDRPAGGAGCRRQAVPAAHDR